MNILKRKIGPYPLGIWFALIGILSSLLAWGMQFYSLINWEDAVRLVFQNESFYGNEKEKTLAVIERGIAFADIIWVMPITVVAFIGIIKEKMVGLIAGMMDFAICVYFPLFFAFQRWNTHPSVVIGAIGLYAIPSLLGIFGLWINRKTFVK